MNVNTISTNLPRILPVHCAANSTKRQKNSKDTKETKYSLKENEESIPHAFILGTR